MPKDSRLKGFLPANTFAMAVLKKRAPAEGAESPAATPILNSTPQPATTHFGRGNPKPELLFVGESFSEAANQLLNKMIEAMGVKVSDVYVAEIHALTAFETTEVEALKPKLIVTLGEAACQALLGKEINLSGVRGKIQKWNNFPVIASFSPEYLLQNPASKKDAWDDLKLAKKQLNWK